MTDGGSAWARRCAVPVGGGRPITSLFHGIFTPAAQIGPSQSAEDPVSQRVSVQLTQQQKAQIKRATGKDAEAIELSVEELEERIAPSKLIQS